MAPTNQLERIAARRQEIAKETSRLQEEDNELAIAEKVIRRLDGDSKPPPENEPKRPPQTDESKLGPTRPSGTPTNFDMVDMILASAEKEGKDGLTAGEIIEAIRSRYWPGLIDMQVSSAIYQFAKKGRFKKTASGKFKRIKKNREGQESIEPNPEDHSSDEDNGLFPMNG